MVLKHAEILKDSNIITKSLKSIKGKKISRKCDLPGNLKTQGMTHKCGNIVMFMNLNTFYVYMYPLSL